jgi:ATP-binding cassette subfamily F protein uup
VTQAKTLSGIVIDQQRKLMAPNKRVRDVLAEAATGSRSRAQEAHQGLSQGLPVRSVADRGAGRIAVGRRAVAAAAGARICRESNLLVLDEPTNDLDLETLDLLQEVIADYDGTVLIVSHDRDFLDRR